MFRKYSISFLVGFFVAFFVGCVIPSEAKAQYNITVSAGGFDRLNTVVSVALPDSVGSGVYKLESESEGSTLIQVDAHNTGWFIIESLEAEATRKYRMEESPVPASSVGKEVTYTFNERTLSFEKGNQSILSFYYKENILPEGLDERYKRGGYIHPVYSPNGVRVTGHLDTEQHPHHYGIWSAWTNTEFQGRTPDFWNVHNNTARVDHADSVETAWQGPVHSGLKAKNYYVDLSSSAPVIALNEEWKLRTYNNPDASQYHIFDITMTHTANTAQPLVLPEYHYGGAAFRGHENWSNPENVSFLTSKGLDREDANATRAKWSYMGGRVEGEKAGIAILSHPDNYRSPQPVRIHPDIPYFVYAPMQLGDMVIEPGSPYVMRYRYITLDGEPDPEELDRLWNDYAYPPGVTVSSE